MMKKIIYASLLMVFSSPALKADSYAFPVPFIRQQHSQIYFKDLPAQGTIKIFTVTGETVKEISFDPTRTDPLPWDVTNVSGKSVATGVYFYQVDGSGQKTTGKLVIIR